MSLKKKIFLLLVLGGVSAFSFAPCYIAPLMMLGVFFFIKFLNQSEKHFSAFLMGGAFGAGIGIISTHWINNALLIDGGQFAIFIPLVWIGFGFWFGLFWAISALGASYFQTGFRRLIAFVGFFIILEWVRSWLFTGFPWNPIGNIWNFFLPIMQIVSVIGIYGLSGLTILFFGLFSLGRKNCFLCTALTLFILVISFGVLRLYSYQNTFVWGTHLRLVQPNIPQTLKWNSKVDKENLAKLIRLSRENNQNRTHILWPETAVSFLINIHEQERLHLMSAIPQGSVLLTGGMRSVNSNKEILANSIFILDDLTDIYGYYDKFHLVPFGEYMPFRKWLPFEKIVPILSDIYAGFGPRTISVLNTLPAGMLVCYEVIFSGQIIDKTNRPSWIFNATNDGWYGISFGPYQHLAMAQTRAIEEGLPLIRVANTGVSAVIDPVGRILKQLDLGEEGVVDYDLPMALPPTFYALFGVKIPLLLAIILLVFAFKKKNSS